MRQRLPDSPQRPIPKPSSLAQRLLKLIWRLLTNLFKLFRWLALIVIGLLALWMIGGNLLAAQQEKRVDQAREQFIQQFPNVEANNSALKLEELSAGLGFGRWLGTKATQTRYLHLPAPKADKTSFENIRKDLDRYLDSQLDKPNDEIDAPPENIRQFLADHAAVLEAIRTHVLSSELPRWELGYDINAVGDLPPGVPSYLSSVNFQKILSVDILDKTRQGQTQAALKTLEVSWKLNQSLLERSEFIGQLVVIINSRPQAVVMRKMQGLPTEWQDRIARFNQYDLPQASLRGLYGEAFYSVSARKYPAIYLFYQFALFEAIDSSSGGSSGGFSVALPQWLSSLFDPLLKPYVRLSAVDYFDRMRQVVLKLPEQDFCAFNPDEFDKQHGAIGWSIFPSGGWAGQWRKVGKAVLRFELTQKVLQVKHLAAKQGRLPRQVPGIESSVCRDGKWFYQLAPDGTALISFSKDLEWMKYRSNPNSPLQYEPGNRLQYSFKPKQSNLTPVP